MDGLIDNLIKNVTNKSKTDLVDIISAQNAEKHQITPSELNQPNELKVVYKTFQFDEDITDKGGEYKQYYYLYSARFKTCFPSLYNLAKNKWPDVEICKSITTLKDDIQQVIIGITFKTMPKMKSVLRENISKLGDNLTKVNLVDLEKDNIAVEDLTGRIRINKELSKTFDLNMLVTGIPVAVKGYLDKKGLFVVLDYDFFHTNIPTDDVLMDTCNSDYYILFLSNLSFGGIEEQNGQLQVARNYLLEFIQNKNLIPGSKMDYISKRLKRVIIAGNSICSPSDIENVEVGSYLKELLNQQVYETILNHYECFEEFLLKVASFIPVDVLPGPNDNTSSNFPDEGMSPILLPSLSGLIQNKIANLVSNPFYSDINGHSFLGTSGNNIRALKMYSLIKEDVEAMKNTLLWGHISPNSPDNMNEYPFTMNDPLILNAIPDFYFTGCSEEFNYSVEEIYGKSTVLFTIPKFSTTCCGIVLNLHSKTFEQICFKNDIILEK